MRASVKKKAKHMILFFARESAADANFGTVKLAKQMFFSDFVAFKKLGQPISGLDYYKLPQGPVPTRAKAIMDDMEKRGELAIEERQVGQTIQRRWWRKLSPTFGCSMTTNWI